MKTAVIYARYSSERQTEQSIEGQIRDCNEYAERNDIVIVDMYIDRAMTGTNDKRNEFQRMLRDSAKRAWDFVLVYKTDRFGRNKYELAMNKHTLKTNGIRLIPVKENIPEGPEGIILESLLEGMAEYYSAELSQKVKRGMRETRNKGNFTGGYLPYGFKKDGKKVIVDVDKAEVVRFIYEQYAKNVYVKDIIAALTDKGILNNGKPFAKTRYTAFCKMRSMSVYTDTATKSLPTFIRQSYPRNCLRSFKPRTTTTATAAAVRSSTTYCEKKLYAVTAGVRLTVLPALPSRVS